MKPMRLLAVFLHEFSHAFLCWITGGKVEAIEVNDNEGMCKLCSFTIFVDADRPTVRRKNII
jgi:Peptidase M50B-like